MKDFVNVLFVDAARTLTGEEVGCCITKSCEGKIVVV